MAEFVKKDTCKAGSPLQTTRCEQMFVLLLRLLMKYTISKNTAALRCLLKGLLSVRTRQISSGLGCRVSRTAATHVTFIRFELI